MIKPKNWYIFTTFETWNIKWNYSTNWNTPIHTAHVLPIYNISNFNTLRTTNRSYVPVCLIFNRKHRTSVYASSTPNLRSRSVQFHSTAHKYPSFPATEKVNYYFVMVLNRNININVVRRLMGQFKFVESVFTVFHKPWLCYLLLHKFEAHQPRYFVLQFSDEWWDCLQIFVAMVM